MRILGLDVGRGTVVAALVDHFPPNPRAYFNSHRREFIRLVASRDGKVDKRSGKLLSQAAHHILDLSPDAIVMEPTGSWYSSFWLAFAQHHAIPVLWVGHSQLAAQRGSYNFVNKRDDEDAYCLALCGLDPTFVDAQGKPRFLEFESGTIAQLRECFHRLKQIDKLKTASVNHLRQRLSREFPEIAERKPQISEKLGFSPLWGWLAELHTYSRIENEYKGSVAREIGIEISQYTRDHALSICNLELRESKTEKELRSLIQEPQFFPYRKVFAQFGFGLRNEALLLVQVYPFDKFLLDGKPWIEWEENRQGELQKRHRSLRSFQLYLGLGYVLKESGKERTIALGGSDLVRSQLYMWCVDRVFPKGAGKLYTPELQTLRAKRDKLDEGQVPGKNKVIRILYRATRMLFVELCKELISN